MANPYDSIDHSNDDDLNNLGEEDLDEVLQYVDDNIVKNHLPQLKQIDELLSNERFQVEKGDPAMNIWQQAGKFRKVKLERKEDVPIFFALLEAERRAGIKDHWTEKQQSGEDPKIKRQPACIMIDIDLYQEDKDRRVQDRHLARLNQELHQLFLSLFDPVARPTGELVVYVAIENKPQLKYDEKRAMWKDGYHIYIYARLKRSDKRYLIAQMQKRNIMTKVFGKEFRDAESFLDTQCCHVPAVMYGSCKADGTPYRLHSVYQWRIEEDGTCIPHKDEHFAQSEHKLNHVLELSLNFDGRAITKLEWQAKPEYTAEVALLRKNARDTSEEDRQHIMDDLSYLSVHDPDASYLRSLLECLRPERRNNHKLRFNTIFALCKGKPQYAPLARWWFKQSHKYTDSKFDEIMNDLGKYDYKLDHSSLAHWASKDSPEKFSLCADKSCFKTLSNLVFDNILEGKLGHADFAKVVQMMLKSKYKTDMRGKKQRVWFEFKFPRDPHRKGEAYKWCEVGSPDSLSIYLHSKLRDLCKQVNEYITKKIHLTNAKIVEALAKKLPAEQEKALKMYYTQVQKNFKSSVRGLSQDGFNRGVLNQSEIAFNSPGFIDSLDQGMMDLGVGNGVLQLSWEGRLPRLIKSYNTTGVSRYTSTPYKQFDPRDPLTRKLLRGMRGMHPDDETDAFEYLMSVLAASIDNRPRPPKIFLITGVGANGKSFRFEMHAAALGDMYCTQMPIAMILQSKEDNGEAPKPFMMKLEAARSAYYEEGPACAVLYMPMIKRVTGCGNLPARNLFEEARTIKSRCYHFVLSNHDFLVVTHEEAVWRRIEYLLQKMIFKHRLEYDPKNPRHRVSDPEFNQEFIHEEATRAAYLSIMTFQHMKLMRNFGGDINAVPHPTIDNDTREFRNRQDTINRFITERLLVSPSQTTCTPIERVIELYCQWYDNNIRQAKHYKEDIKKQLLDSALKDIIETNTYGANLLKGYRIMDGNYEITPGDVFFSKGGARAAHKKEYSMEFKPETPDEYIERVEREWIELLAADRKEQVNLKGTYDYDSEDEDRADGDIKTEWQERLENAAEPDMNEVQVIDVSEDPIERLKKVFKRAAAESDADSESDDEAEADTAVRNTYTSDNAIDMLDKFIM